MNKKTIESKNSKGQYHGYQESYAYGEIQLRGMYKHGLEIGYEEYHGLKKTNFYIK